MKYAYIQSNSDQYPVAILCLAMNVSTSAYYRWLQNPVSKRDLIHFELDEEIHGVFTEHQSRYGARRIYEDLKARGFKVTEAKVSQRMKLMGLVSKQEKRFIKTTDSVHNQYIRHNLLQQDFTASKPNEKWVTDITYIPTDEGWMYLCVIIDLFSRIVVGWCMADHMRSELTVNALRMAAFNRKLPRSVIMHSDKGSQYACKAFQDEIETLKFTSSMSGKGCCYDNAACESFFGTLKVELCDDESYKTVEQAKSSVFEYIETYYNRKRRHSTINYMTPNQFEDTMKSVNQKCPKFAG